MPVITLNAAGGSFGDGRHPSTQGALRLMAGLEHLHPACVLDVGCGSGILSLAALSLWPGCRVIAGDIQPAAVEATRHNAAEQDLGDRLQAVRSTGVEHPLIRSAAPYPLVVSNILAEPLLQLAADLSQITAPGGWLILSGILMWREALLQDAYRLTGMQCAEVLAIGEWRSMLLHRPI